jgi:sugar lactone lactonase YvrE
MKNARFWSWFWCSLGFAILGTASFLAWQHFSPVRAAEGWVYRIYRDDIPMVSAMLIDPHGDLYVSQEFRRERGGVFKLGADGSRRDIVTGLSKPDGLALFMDGIAIAQESGEFPVFLWREGKTEPLFVGNGVEGITSDGHVLFAIEDVKQNGRLLKYDPSTGETVTLRDGLEEGEGLAVCPDGRLFYTEKQKGWIKKWQSGSADEIVVRGLRAPGFLLCDAAGLWITEDSSHRARLLLLDASGTPRTVLAHLRSAQSVISTSDGRLLVAEQGRGRILEVRRDSDAQR